ncbi:hypothetical protein Enr8_42550 [Blastopirellula retiformator]|uniref:Uncharacterized protein n=1 Tax=Blastopirellula retiformator TaxID=2527970 RepID=A0A5C5UZ15_9BACT|nr:hypothetical protein Enr8_42550 [Blastopirellula retiformator]
MKDKVWQMIVIRDGRAAATMLGCSREMIYSSVRAFNEESERLENGAKAFPCMVSVTPSLLISKNKRALLEVA